MSLMCRYVAQLSGVFFCYYRVVTEQGYAQEYWKLLWAFDAYWHILAFLLLCAIVSKNSLIAPIAVSCFFFPRMCFSGL